MCVRNVRERKKAGDLPAHPMGDAGLGFQPPVDLGLRAFSN